MQTLHILSPNEFWFLRSCGRFRPKHYLLPFSCIIISKMLDLGPKQSTRHFVSRELRYSVAFIVIASLVAGIGFIVLAKAINAVVSPEAVTIVIMVGYAALVFLLTMVFAHRFVGPFQRLKMEIRLILGGNYSGKLKIRKRDDPYIKSFIEEINHLLNEFEKMHLLKESLIKTVDEDLEALSDSLNTRSMTKEELLETIESCRNKTRETLKKYRYRYERTEEKEKNNFRQKKAL